VACPAFVALQQCHYQQQQQQQDDATMPKALLLSNIGQDTLDEHSGVITGAVVSVTSAKLLQLQQQLHGSSSSSTLSDADSGSSRSTPLRQH
jgi:hypothetical protein